MAVTTGFTDLTTVPTQAQTLNNEVLPQLVANGVAVTSWPIGDPYRAMAQAVAFMRQMARQFIASLTSAGFEDYAFGRTAAPGGMDVTGWAPLIAKQRYGIVQKKATYTQRTITLTNSTATPYNNLAPGSIILQFPSGNRYFLQGGQSTLGAALGIADTTMTVASTTGFPSSGTLLVDSEQITYTGLTSTTFTGLTRGANGSTAAAHLNFAAVTQVINIPANGSASVTFRSEFQYGASSTYNQDLPGSTIAFVTSSFPGVTATNTAPTYSPVAQSGSGVGTITPSGSPSGQHNVTVQITGSGSVAGASVTWSVSVDGGAFVSQTGYSATNLGGISGLNVALSDNGGGSTAFVVGTYYYVTTPGTDITQVGAAVETPQSLGQRVAGLWPLLAFQTDQYGNFVPPASPTTNAYIALALSQPNVVVAFANTDANINNKINMYVAGQGGASLPAANVAAIQTLFKSFNMLTDQLVVFTPVGRAITLSLSSGTIQCRSSQLASAQQIMTQRLQAYFGGTDQAQPLSINGLIDYDYVLALIRTTPGVTHVPAGALQITANAVNYTTDVQLPITVGAVEVATWAQTAASAFTWQTV